MFETLIIIIAVVFGLGTHFFVVARGRLILGPETVFLAMGVATYLATLIAAARLTGSFSHIYSDYIGLGLITFVLGTVAGHFSMRFNHQAALRRFQLRRWRDDFHGFDFTIVLAIGLVSILVTLAYFVDLGFIVPLRALKALATADIDQVSRIYNDARRLTRTADVFLGPGYVFQFKNCLLPLAAIICYFRFRLRAKPGTGFLFLGFMSMAVLATIGTGARFYFAFFALSFLFIGLSPLMEPFRFTRRHLIVGSLAAGLLLSGMTLLMGTRGQETLVDVPILWAPLQVFDRVASSPAEERFRVYELYLAGRPPRLGAGLKEQLEIMLPGKPEYTLSSQLHELLHGSETGNVGLDVWGSLWYDFHWFGIAITFALGLLYHGYYVWMIRGPKRFIRIITLLFSGLLLGFATDIQVLVLRGFLACMALLALLSFARLMRPAQRPVEQ